MLMDTQAELAWVSVQAGSEDHKVPRGAPALYRERKWRQLEPGCATEDIVISRWTDLGTASRQAEAISPPDHYFIGIALKTTRLRLIRGRRTIFEGVMPAGSLYVSAPSEQLSAQFDAPFDFLHFHVSADHFPQRESRFISAEDLNDLVLLRNSFAE